METKSFVKKFRLLTIGLICSALLNGGLGIALVSILLQDNQRIPFRGSLPQLVEVQEEVTNRAVASAFSTYSFHELATLLTNKERLEDGYLKRDLALATLVAMHAFDLERALGGISLQHRKQESLELFPGLTDEHFLAIIRFLHEEEWPLTPRGLFDLLKQKGKQAPEGLIEAFAVTSYFHGISLLFPKVSNSTLIDLVCKGTWEQFEEQARVLDRSDERRRSLLLSYLLLGSSTAAEILLQTDYSFALKKLDDATLLSLLNCLSAENSLVQNFCFSLMQSPRSDAVRERSAQLLHQPVPAAPSEPIFVHVVKEGETLWSIARQYSLKLEELVALNGLVGEKIRPGLTLKIKGNQPLRDERDGSAKGVLQREKAP